MRPASAFRWRGLADRLRSVQHTRAPRARPSRPTRAAIALALAVAAAAGCAGSPSDATVGTPQRSLLLESRDPLFLILPLNFATGVPPELVPLEPVVWEELEHFLRARGKQLKTISRESARRLLSESMAEVRSRQHDPRSAYDEAAGTLARKLRASADFEAMVLPSLFVREAPLEDREARWDGVARQVPFTLRGVDAQQFADAPLEGVVPAGSLHVAVFDATGAKLHEGLGGLDVLVGVLVTGANLSGQPNLQLVERSGPIGDRGFVREAVATAFSPLLGPVAE